MSEFSTRNFLNYTNLTYSEIISQVNNRLRQDTRFENFRESEIAQMIVEIFSATADLNNYYIERRAEEQFYDTARLRSSIIQIAKQLGYVVIRSVPSSTALKMTIKGPLPSGLLPEQDQISLVKFESKFTHKGLSYFLAKTYTYTLTQEDIDDGVGNSEWSKDIEVSVVGEPTLNSDGNIPTSATQPITMYQGELTSATFEVTEGGKFQRYFIDDVKFSNYYGDRDFGYNVDTGEIELTENVTQIGVGSNYNNALLEENLYEIDRRSLLTSETVLDSTSLSADVPKVCTVSTTMNEGIEIQFGDGKLSTQPQVGQVIVARYLSTEGSKPNIIGVIGDKLTTNNIFKASVSNIDLTNNLEFKLYKNITGGADMESAESIKINAPSLFYSLDRLVTKTDYITYLKSLTSPLNIKNAIAWGEQEEIEEQGLTALNKLLNVVLHSVLGEMYYFPTEGEAIPRSLSGDTIETNLTQVVLEGNDYSIISTEDGLGFSEQVYFNTLVQGNIINCTGQTGVIEELGRVQEFPSDNPVTILNNELEKRSQITIKHIYISPIIQEFYLDGEVYINRLANQTETKIKINNVIYDYLNDNADFATEIYLSKITEIVESYPEVLYSNLKFKPANIPSTYPIIEGEVIDDPNVSQADLTTEQKLLLDFYIASNMRVYLGLDDYYNNSDSRYWRLTDSDELTPPNVTNALSQDRYSVAEYENTSLSDPPWFNYYANTGGFLTDERVHFRNGAFTERSFYYDFMKNLYNDIKDNNLNGYENTDNFKYLMVKLNNSMKKTIRNNMLDSNDNITNFSLKNEVAKIEIIANYRYRT